MCALVTETFTAKTRQELAQIDGLLHDQLFDLEGMLHDEVAKKLTIPFMVEDVDREAVIKRTRRGRPKLVWVPLRRATLEVENVSDYAVRDRSQIGTYTANDLLFREKTQRLIIEANEDCEIEVDLDSLGVRLEVQDEIIARVKRRYFRSSDSTWGLVEGPWPFD